VAANIVTASLRVREGEAVLITGSPRDGQLLEDLAVQVRRQGAHPLVRMVTDRMRRGMVVDVPDGNGEHGSRQ
jgi:leucyl aminopeptidase (aminopeptidase T)